MKSQKNKKSKDYKSGEKMIIKVKEETINEIFCILKGLWGMSVLNVLRFIMGK